MVNLMRSRYGRALVAIRDSDTAAEAMGVNLARYKMLAFGISAAYTGVAGALLAHFLGYIGPDHFTVLLSIEYLTMIILGGLGSILGSVLGAFVITLLPEVLRFVLDVAEEREPRPRTTGPESVRYWWRPDPHPRIRARRTGRSLEENPALLASLAFLEFAPPIRESLISRETA